jgi:hypothetical protein
VAFGGDVEVLSTRMIAPSSCVGAAYSLESLDQRRRRVDRNGAWGGYTPNGQFYHMIRTSVATSTVETDVVRSAHQRGKSVWLGCFTKGNHGSGVLL